MSNANKKKEISITIALIIFCIVQFFTLILRIKEHEIMKGTSKEGIENSKLTMRKLEADLLRDYLSCKFEQRVCDILYPSAFETVKKAKAETGEK